MEGYCKIGQKKHVRKKLKRGNITWRKRKKHTKKGKQRNHIYVKKTRMGALNRDGHTIPTEKNEKRKCNLEKKETKKETGIDTNTYVKKYMYSNINILEIVTYI